MSRRILVSGATGFIGRHLVAALLARGETVDVALRPGTALPAAWQDRVGQQAFGPDGRLADPAGVAAAGYQAIVNLAAYGVHPSRRDEAQMLAVNMGLPVDLLRAAGRNCAFVSLGSCSEYDVTTTDSHVDEGWPLEAFKLYGATKAAGGLMAMEAARAAGTPMRLLRAFNVYGPGEAPHRLLPSLLAATEAHESIPFSAGTQVRDFVHVDDVVEGIVRTVTALVERRCTGVRALNLCTGTGSTVQEFVRQAARMIGLSEARLDFGALAMRPDEIPWLVGSKAAMENELDWSPTLTLSQGLRRTVQRP